MKQRVLRWMSAWPYWAWSRLPADAKRETMRAHWKSIP